MEFGLMLGLFYFSSSFFSLVELTPSLSHRLFVSCGQGSKDESLL